MIPSVFYILSFHPFLKRRTVKRTLLQTDNIFSPQIKSHPALHIEDEKLQYEINREAAKISAFSSGKIDTYEYLTGEEILPFHQKKR